MEYLVFGFTVGLIVLFSLVILASAFMVIFMWYPEVILITSAKERIFWSVLCFVGFCLSIGMLSYLSKVLGNSLRN